ncbi:gastrin/cholecystokinin type B receptor-like [Mya arenaria]|uniref:gastrin/cholecystokinin type B receptor-like n=1 Tax=Mya arenaria TaxID=6604 RepID=UPI0022E52021|nr:gastrin/cholecystokinin type B receptor-like [Mya arenaria]
MYSPFSHVDGARNWTEGDLSLEKASTLVGSIVYLCILMVVGMVGNIFVLLIFYFRFTPSTDRCFIITLAIYDFFACAVGAPWEIAESFFAFNYQDVITCKIFRFILYYTCIASSLTLVLIAIERSRKICTPLKSQLSVPMAKRAICVVVLVISTISASPALVLYGNKTIPTGYKNVTGTKCFVTDHFSETFWPKVFNIYLLALAFLSTAIMAVCYIRIARTVSRMGMDRISKRMKAYEMPNAKSVDSVARSEDDVNDSDSTYQQNFNFSSTKQNHQTPRSESSVMPSDNVRVAMSTSATPTRSKFRDRSLKRVGKLLRRLSSKSGRKTLRVTKMLTFVTVAFVVSYLPHLSLQLWSMFNSKEIEHTLPTDNFYQVLFYSFLINNLVTPFIYATMDLKFKNELKKLLACGFNIGTKKNTVLYEI